MIAWGAVLLSMAVGAAGGAVPVRRIVDTADAVYFEPTAASQQGVVWVYPKTRAVVARSAQDPAYLQADLILREVQLPDDLSTLEPGWRGKQALFYQVTAQSECILRRLPEMKFIQQWVRAKGVTIPGAQRSAICSFTFQLRPETPALIRQLEEDAEAGRLLEHGLRLHLSVPSFPPLPWATLHTSLVRGGVQPGDSRTSELAAFELGLLGEVRVLQSQPSEVQRSFLETALQNLFGWHQGSPRVQLTPTAPAGQYEGPSVPSVISL
jgi:hypothetical protein